MPEIKTVQTLSVRLNRPGAGAEQWGNGSAAVGGLPVPLDVYRRLTWAQLENQTKGVYNFTPFNNLANDAISKKQKLSLGIMSCYPGGSTGEGNVAYPDGGTSAYPLWLHKAMQAESVKDWRTGDSWTPNYNSQHYLNGYFDFLKALYNHINTAKSPGGVPYKNMFQFFDVRGFGAWGEWNSSYTPNNNTSDYPAGTFPTVATFKRIIDIHALAFPNFYLQNMIAVFDGDYLQNTRIPAEVGEYALNARNNKGPFGWRRDQWGARDQYLKDYLENNTRVNRTKIMERWKVAPITGEPMPSGDAMGDLVRQIQLYHAVSFGNGNYGNVSGATLNQNVQAADQAAGYKLVLTGGVFTNTNSNINITMNWRNFGNSPTYEDWVVKLVLKNAAGATVLEIEAPAFKPKLFLPSGVAAPFTDSLAINAPAGAYTLAVKIVDPNGYRDPMPLYIEGRQADGSYNLGPVSIGSQPVPNQPPVVSVGPNQEITLPTNIVTLQGSATDKDGSIAASGWRKVSGSGNVTTTTGNSTTVSDLTEGISVFEFYGQDDKGARSTAQMQVKVNPKPVDPVPPVKTVTDVTTVTKSTVHYSDGSKEDFPKT